MTRKESWEEFAERKKKEGRSSDREERRLSKLAEKAGPLGAAPARTKEDFKVFFNRGSFFAPRMEKTPR